jgi:transposase
MGKPHPVELRQRVVDHVAKGNTHRAAAERFKVSVKFVNDMVKLKAATGGLAPKPQGNGGGHGKLAGLKDWVARRIGETRDLTAAALAAEIAVAHGVTVRRGSVWSLLRDLGLTHKKDLRAVEQKRPEVAEARRIWITKRQPFMANLLTRIGFIDVEAG